MSESTDLPDATTNPGARKSKPGMESVISVVLGVYGLYLAVMLVKDLIGNEIGVRFELTDATPVSLEAGSSSVALSGLTDITVPTTVLAPETLVLLIISNVTVVIAFIGSAFACLPVLRDIAQGTPFTPRAVKALAVLSWLVTILIVIYVVTTTFGSNLASRDLGIADAVTGGLGITQVFAFLGIAGGIALLQRSFASARRAQEELEGLV